MIKRRKILITCAAMLCMAGTVTAALDSVQLGTPIEAGTMSIPYYFELDVGMAANGDFVCALGRYDGSYSMGIWKRAFNADGTAKDPVDVAVNTYTANEQRSASIGVRKDGTYDIAWGSYGKNAVGVSSVVMKGYNADGSIRYGEVITNPGRAEYFPPPDPEFWYIFPGNNRAMPSVAVYNNADANDGALLTVGDYQHKSYPAKVTKSGTVLFSDNPEYTDGITPDLLPDILNMGWTSTGVGSNDVAVMDNGDGVILAGSAHEGDPNSTRAKYVVFDRSAGTNGEFDPVSRFVTGLFAQTLGNAAGKGLYTAERWQTSVAMNGTGSGVMVWMVRTGDVATGQTDVVARRFTLGDVEGIATLAFTDATEWLVNEVTTADQYWPRVAIDDDGRFVTTWTDDDGNLYGRAFNEDGTGLPQFRINPAIPTGTERYRAASVAVNKDGQGNMDFVLTYTYNPNPDRNQGGVEADNHAFAIIGSALKAVVQLPGDLDHDCDVDIFDWAIFQPNYGKSGMTPDQGDLDGDTDIDIFDWAIFQPNYGKTCGGEPVPEPATLILLAAGSAILPILRRRRS